MREKYAIGTDIGGSHISTVLVDVENRTIIKESLAKQKVDNKASAEEILKNWSMAIQTTLQHLGDKELLGIGFAMPGPFDYVNGVSFIKNVDKYENLYGINVSNELKKILGLSEKMPFRYLNDALSFAVGESWIGKAASFHNVVAITLGTGFGSAFLTKGVPVIEGERVPQMGCVYHIPYGNSIADDYFSTRWFIKAWQERSGETCKGVKEIADKANVDEAAKKLFEDFGTNIGNFMVPFLKKFDAHCLVIGGNITGAWPLFGPFFEKRLQAQQLSIKVLISGLGESAAMAGSARLFEEGFWKQVSPLLSKI